MTTNLQKQNYVYGIYIQQITVYCVQIAYISLIQWMLHSNISKSGKKTLWPINGHFNRRHEKYYATPRCTCWSRQTDSQTTLWLVNYYEPVCNKFNDNGQHCPGQWQRDIYYYVLLNTQSLLQLPLPSTTTTSRRHAIRSTGLCGAIIE